eukprot:gene11789-13009_t
MGDSDDEHDRRRVRDKFRGERSEYEQRRPRGGDYRERRDWADRRPRDNWSGGGRDQNWDRKRSGQYYGRTRRDSEGGEGQISPPMKRNRRDWDTSYDKPMGGGNMMHSAGGVWTSGSGRGHMPAQHRDQDRDQNKQGQGDSISEMKGSQAPRMMSFKAFLLVQEENIDELEAVRRYQEYKTEFRRTQLSDFFVLHKNEEWFRNKYHPVDVLLQAKEKRNFVRKRLKVFLDLLEMGYMENLSLDGSNTDAIVKLLDAVAIKLEGGTDEDLAALDDAKTGKESSKSRQTDSGQRHREDDKKRAMKKDVEASTTKEDETEQSPSSVPLPDTPEITKGEAEASKKREKRTSSENTENGSEASSSESEAEQAPQQLGDGKDDEKDDAKVTGNDDAGAVVEARVSDLSPSGSADVKEASKDGMESVADDEKESGSSATSMDDDPKENVLGKGGLGAYLAMMQNESSKKEDETTEDTKKEDEAKEDESLDNSDLKPKEEKKSKKRDWEGRKGTGLGAFVARLGGEGISHCMSMNMLHLSGEKFERFSYSPKEIPERKELRDAENGDRRYENDDPTESKDYEPEGRQFHKTLSLFMRLVPPKISKADIATVCKRQPGYLRVALADPNPERGFCRRGWVTFENVVNIKDICWNLSNIRIRDCELNPVINRDLSKRIRPISGLTLSKQLVRFDIKLSAQLIKALDDRLLLYSKDADAEDNAKDENAMDVEGESNGAAASNEQENDAKECKDGEQTQKMGRNAASQEILQLPESNPIIEALPEIATESEEGEEMELIGDKESKDDNQVDFTRDDNLMKALDKLLLYLRIVHSLDYYNCTDYPYEDEMPNRCGVLHVRGSEPEKANYSDVVELQKSVRQKLKHFIEKQDAIISDSEVQKLGKKNVDEYPFQNETSELHTHCILILRPPCPDSSEEVII